MMKKLLFTSLMLAMCSLGLQACDDNDGEGGGDTETCKNVCKDANTLTQCKADGSKEDVNCPNGCDNGACKNNQGGSESGTCKNVCKDANTLSQCKADGSKEDVNCPNGCENDACKSDNKPGPACETKCKNAYTLSQCNADGTISDITCQGVCENNACKSDDNNKCENSCKDIDTLIKCNADGTITEVHCNNGCENKECKNQGLGENTAHVPTSCTKLTETTCYSDTSSYICSDFWRNEGDDFIDLYLQTCAGNRTCKDNTCVVKDEKKCGDNYCKDINTLVECKDGTPTEKACGAGQLCIDSECIDTTFKACKADADCGSADQVCHDGLCYAKANIEVKAGDPCKINEFVEFCKDGVEYYCYGTVETYDCKDANGCSAFIKKSYPTNKPVVDATCRGKESDLKACTQPGVVLNRCSVGIVEDMSLGSVCVKGTDGQMIYVTDHVQKNCADNKTFCNKDTGRCDIED